MNKLAAIYLRVSTDWGTEHQQIPEVQQKPIEDLISNRGWKVFKVYCDRGTGANQNRPAFQALMSDAHRGRFQVVAVWSLDRWARKLTDCLASIEELHHLGIDFVSVQQPVDTTTPAGKLFYQMTAVFAEFEREILRERIRAGIQYAKREGTKSGNPIGRPKKVFRRDEAVELRRQGVSLREIARRLDVGYGTVRREWAKNLFAETAQG